MDVEHHVYLLQTTERERERERDRERERERERVNFTFTRGEGEREMPSSTGMFWACIRLFPPPPPPPTQVVPGQYKTRRSG